MTDLFGPAQPENLADLVTRYAHVDAVRRFAGDELTRLKGRIGEHADLLEDVTGAAFRAPVTGIGTALRTDPEPKPRVTDRDALAAWFAEHHPDACGERREVRVRPDVNHELLIEVLEAGDNRADELAWHLEVVTTVLLPSADPCTWLIDNGHAVLGLDGLHSTTDGELIPGTGVARADRQLRVTVDKAYRQQLADHLQANYLPQLETSS